MLLDRGQVVELASDGEVVGVVQAGLGAQQPVALLVLLDVGAEAAVLEREGAAREGPVAEVAQPGARAREISIRSALLGSMVIPW